MLPMLLMPLMPLMLPMLPMLPMPPMPGFLPPGKRRAAPGGPPKRPLRKKTSPCDGKNHPKHVQ
jgi:hypothetical protein